MLIWYVVIIIAVGILSLIVRGSAGGLIHCHDCGTAGFIEFDGPWECNMPQGWHVVRCGLRHQYFCPNCANRRIERVKHALSIHRGGKTT